MHGKLWVIYILYFFHHALLNVSYFFKIKCKNILIQLKNVFWGVVVGADFTIFHVKKKKRQDV